MPRHRNKAAFNLQLAAFSFRITGMTGKAFEQLATALKEAAENMQTISLNIKQQTAAGLGQTRSGVAEIDKAANNLKDLI